MEIKRIAVFASGTGSNFRTLLEKIEEKYIPAVVSILLTDNSNAGAIEIALSHKIPFKVLKPKDFESRQQFDLEMLSVLQKYNAEAIVLAGYLKLIGAEIVNKYRNKIVNIHPALLPAFGGKGMYGQNVHRAVFESGVKLSGATVHLVNEEYDRGPIIIQRSVDISDLNSPDEIAKRVLSIEHQIYPQAVKWLVEDRIRVEQNRTIIEKDL